jgi:hypothetical protein
MQDDLFEAYRSRIVGKRVSSVWRGHGSAIFLEFGNLSPSPRRDGSSGRMSGDYGVMMEWSWRIADQRSVLCGSWSDEDNWQEFLPSLEGRGIEGLSLFGRLPELSIALSGGIHVASFMTADGQPAWTIFDRTRQNNSELYLCVENGVVCQRGTMAS